MHASSQSRFPGTCATTLQNNLSRKFFLGIVSCMNVVLTLTNVSDKILHSVKLCNLNYVHFPTALITVI